MFPVFLYQFHTNLIGNTVHTVYINLHGGIILYVVPFVLVYGWARTLDGCLESLENRYECCCMLCLSRRNFQKLQVRQCMIFLGSIEVLGPWNQIAFFHVFQHVCDNTSSCLGSNTSSF
jgi:hypothetical protein